MPQFLSAVKTTQSGVRILDTDNSHYFIIACGENLTADRSLTVNLGDTSRNLTVTGDTTLNGGTHSGTNTGDQDLSGYQPLDTQLTALAALSYSGNGGKVVAVNGAENGFELIVSAGGSGTSIKETITQAGHGFAAKDVIRFSGGGYIKAQADTAINAEAVGIVESVSGDDFTVVYGGRISGLSGLTANTLYFLDASVAGALTSTEPTGTNVSKPILLATSTTSGIVLEMRGMIGCAVPTQPNILEIQVFS